MATHQAPWRRCVLAAGCAGLLILGAAPAASADEEDTGLSEQAPPEEPEEGINQSSMSNSVLRYDPSRHLIRYDPQNHIEDLGGSEAEEEDVIVLETDILFSPNEWELPGHAGARIGELVDAVPEGAAVSVEGHTDSNPVDETVYDFDNQELSENRAQAVADALEEERPDLALTVEGFGDSDPAVREDAEDPDTFAANRRVEIRYG